MSEWSRLSPDEVERRRQQSIAALKEIERQEWDRRYQEECDKLYWTVGKCCAGCDHWESIGGLTGNCLAAGIMSGEDVIRSLGWSFSSYIPPPGMPFTEARDYCGKFSDAFDWSELDKAYLSRIGALKDGALKQKPMSAATQAKEPPHDPR